MKNSLFLIIVTIFMFFFCLTNIQAEKVTLIDGNKIIDDLKAEIKQKPNDIGARIELGVMYFQLQEYELARKEFEAAIAIDNKNAIAHYNFGKTLIMMKKEEEGIRECEKSLELGLDDLNVYQTLSQAYLDKRELQKSLKMYENIKRLNPKDDKAYFACGVLYIGLKDGWKAREEFKKAVELNPNNANVHYELGWLYADYEPEYAKKELQRALELDPNINGAREELKRLEARKQ
jgi:tetratricopeptide (TPR) repeat protein